MYINAAGRSFVLLQVIFTTRKKQLNILRDNHQELFWYSTKLTQIKGPPSLFEWERGKLYNHHSHNISNNSHSSIALIDKFILEKKFDLVDGGLNKFATGARFRTRKAKSIGRLCARLVNASDSKQTKLQIITTSLQPACRRRGNGNLRDSTIAPIIIYVIYINTRHNSWKFAVYKSLARDEKLLCVRNVIIYTVQKCLLSATIINIDRDDTFRVSAVRSAQTNVT